MGKTAVATLGRVGFEPCPVQKRAKSCSEVLAVTVSWNVGKEAQWLAGPASKLSWPTTSMMEKAAYVLWPTQPAAEAAENSPPPRVHAPKRPSETKGREITRSWKARKLEKPPDIRPQNVVSPACPAVGVCQATQVCIEELPQLHKWDSTTPGQTLRNQRVHRRPF